MEEEGIRSVGPFPLGPPRKLFQLSSEQVSNTGFPGLTLSFSHPDSACGQPKNFYLLRHKLCKPHLFLQSSPSEKIVLRKD